ncbi:aspartate ammonia-lyase, partial [Escherichia coli]|nr:aspartate ammonia-lyase [Escherichia coli]MRF83398.1 aspartate ammonia-lyase [Escherichia coli]MRG51520.1 aspartate ammonia-lyase [Escherichia coli]
HLGYKVCPEMAHEAYHTGKSLHQIVVVERKLLTQEEWEKTFNLDNLIAPKFEQ